MAWVFYCKSSANFQNTFSQKHLWRAVSVSLKEGTALQPLTKHENSVNDIEINDITPSKYVTKFFILWKSDNKKRKKMMTSMNRCVVKKMMLKKL